MSTPTRPTKVLIVDDSAVVRQVLTAGLSTDHGLNVLGAVADPIFAMERMNREWPDVIVLDIEMPRMDGITFLKKLMSVRPTPVVICSTLTEQGARTTMQALAAGAVAIVTKPTSGLKQFLQEETAELIRTVKAAAAGDMRRVKAASVALNRVSRLPMSSTSPRDSGSPRGALAVTTDRVVAIGSSTGGTQALELILTALPSITAGIVIVQHMPEKFTAAFATRLNSMCEAEVLEAADGDRVLTGRVLIAPGGLHMAIRRDGAQYRVKITAGERVNRHKPSVDVLFESVATNVGSNALGILLTGMGDDGARGLLAMRTAGAPTVGQDEASCVVYGMPAAAKHIGAVEREASLTSIAPIIASFADRR